MVSLEPDWSLEDRNGRLLLAIEVAPVSQPKKEVMEKGRKWLENCANVRAVVMINFDEKPRYARPTSWDGIVRSVAEFQRLRSEVEIGKEIKIDGHCWFGECKAEVTVFRRLGYFEGNRPAELQQEFGPEVPATPYTGPPAPGASLRPVLYSEDARGFGDVVEHEEFISTTGSFEMKSTPGGFEGMEEVDFALQQVFRVVSLCCSGDDDAGFEVDWELVTDAAWAAAKHLAENRWMSRPREQVARVVKKKEDGEDT